jgi:glycosyltransferase involved in cell wall biosynthesis
VVIPAFNRAATIRGAIESVLRQTYSDFELVVVDDGSSDGTLEAAAEVRDPRVRLVASPRNMGAAAARNRGVDEARGAWIAFQDSDDEWLPGKLEKQMARLEAPGYGGAYCGLLTLGGLEDRADARMRPSYIPDPGLALVDGHILETLLRGNMISTQTLVVRRDLFLELGRFDEDTTPVEDWDFALRLAARGPIAFVDEPLVHQRFSPNSITRGAARRLASHQRVIVKNMALYEGRPDLLALQYYILAGDSRNAGKLADARRFLALARSTHPASPRPWAMTLYVAALSAIAPLRGGGGPNRTSL